MNDIRARVLWYSAMRLVRKYHPTILAITGSIAKTSTKKAVSILLEKAYPGQIRTAYGNLNSYPYGVPLAILDFRINFHEQKIGKRDWLKILAKALWRGFFTKLPDYLLLEYGTDKPGDIKAICEKLPPDIGVITITGPAHLEAFGTVEAVAEDKGYIAETTKKDGWLFVNSEDQFLTHYHSRTKARVVNVVCSLEEIAPKFMEAIGRQLGIKPEVIKEAGEEYLPPSGRLNYIQLRHIKLLDDSYNASPLAMKAAFNTLKKMPGHKLAILGSMREMGDQSAKYHKEVGVLAATVADKVIAVGPEAKDYKAEIWYEDSEKAAEHILDDIKKFELSYAPTTNSTTTVNNNNISSRKPADFSILVKGSRSVHMEKIVKVIMENNN